MGTAVQQRPADLVGWLAVLPPLAGAAGPGTGSSGVCLRGGGVCGGEMGMTDMCVTAPRVILRRRWLRREIGLLDQDLAQWADEQERRVTIDDGADAWRKRLFMRRCELARELAGLSQ